MADSSYKICTKTVMDTSDSRISFNEEGICDHAVDFLRMFFLIGIMVRVI